MIWKIRVRCLERAEQLPSHAWDEALGPVVTFAAIPRSNDMSTILVNNVSTWKMSYASYKGLGQGEHTNVTQVTGGPLHS